MSHFFAGETLYQTKVLLVGLDMEIVAAIFSHLDVVLITFIQGICLGSFSSHLFWAIIGIMALVVAFEAKHFTDISPGFIVRLVGSQLPILLGFYKC